jgi:hypothetical protein
LTKERSPPHEWFQGRRFADTVFDSISLSSKHESILVEAGVALGLG